MHAAERHVVEGRALRSLRCVSRLVWDGRQLQPSQVVSFPAALPSYRHLVHLWLHIPDGHERPLIGGVGAAVSSLSSSLVSLTLFDGTGGQLERLLPPQCLLPLRLLFLAAPFSYLMSLLRLAGLVHSPLSAACHCLRELSSHTVVTAPHYFPALKHMPQLAHGGYSNYHHLRRPPLEKYERPLLHSLSIARLPGSLEAYSSYHLDELQCLSLHCGAIRLDALLLFASLPALRQLSLAGGEDVKTLPACELWLGGLKRLDYLDIRCPFAVDGRWLTRLLGCYSSQGYFEIEEELAACRARLRYLGLQLMANISDSVGEQWPVAKWAALERLSVEWVTTNMEWRWDAASFALNVGVVGEQQQRDDFDQSSERAMWSSSEMLSSSRVCSHRQLMQHRVDVIWAAQLGSMTDLITQ